MAIAQTRTPGLIQGVMLILPITLTVIGVSVFTATIAQTQEFFRDIPNGDYLVNLMQTMPGFWIVVFSPIAGWLADRFGRMQILLWAMAVYAITGFVPFFMTDIYWIIVTRCFVGMCESIILTVTTAMLCDYFTGQTRERWLASQAGLASLSALIIIPLGGYLGAVFGWQGPFLVYLVSFAFMLGVIIFCWEPPHVDESAEGQDDASVRYYEFPWARMAGIVAITLFASMAFYTTITQNANALVELGLAPTDAGRIGELSALASLGVPIGTAIYWALSKLHIGYLLFIEFLLIGIGFVLMGQASTPFAYALSANLQQIGCGMTLPTLLVWASSGLAYRIRGRGAGTWQGAFGIGLFLSGATLTFAGRQLGGLLPAFDYSAKSASLRPWSH